MAPARLALIVLGLVSIAAHAGAQTPGP
ncbi:MAG: hypothetical protein JWL71_134, partial [Acidobacteria bacterium]|nr:hypothetical protein [Acidobacteriota bacterium]